MPMNALRDHLDENRIKYVTIRHSPAYTAPEIAACAHIPGREMVKTVMVEMDGTMAMVVMPSNEQVDLERLRKITGVRDVKLAVEEQFKDLFPGCEPGAMPPFGNLWGLKVYASPTLRRDEKIAFNAGSHTELVQMRYEDFEGLVQPEILEIAAN